MYLDGQLPLGPDSDNNNPPQIDASAISSLVQVTYLQPGYGDAIVSPTIATANGIVQTPVQQPDYHVAAPRNSSYDCGDYAASGSLATLRNRAGRGMGYGLSGCNSGYQMNVENKVQDGLPGSALLAIGAGLALIVASADGGRR